MIYYFSGFLFDLDFRVENDQGHGPQHVRLLLHLRRDLARIRIQILELSYITQLYNNNNNNNNKTTTKIIITTNIGRTLQQKQTIERNLTIRIAKSECKFNSLEKEVYDLTSHLQKNCFRLKNYQIFIRTKLKVHFF